MSPELFDPTRAVLTTLVEIGGAFLLVAAAIWTSSRTAFRSGPVLNPERQRPSSLPPGRTYFPTASSPASPAPPDGTRGATLHSRRTC